MTKDRYHYLHQVRDTQIIPAHIEASEEVETIFTLPYDIGYTLPQTGNKWSLTDSQLQRYVELRDGDVQRRLQHADEEDEVEPL